MVNYLGISLEKLRIGSFEFTCCEGCQLQLVNKEATLEDFLGLLNIRNFREISSEQLDDYDLALVEGSISRSDEIERLQSIREKSKILVAFGSCACFGGVNCLKNRYPLDETVRAVYGEAPVDTMMVKQISDVVKVDFFLPGCPVSKDEVERLITNLVMGSLISLPKYPVCMECKARLNTCLFDLGEICLGPLTRAGCNAVCTTGKTACLGCRGPADDINFPAFRQQVLDRGLDLDDMREKLGLYNAFEAYLSHEG